jgi:predicted permease
MTSKMNDLFKISYEIILPIFLLIGLGYLVQKRIGFDLRSLTRLNFWIFVPSFLFVRIYSSTLSGDQLLKIFSHFALLFSAQFAIGWYLAPLFGAGDRLRRAMTASILFYNSGNYGIPAARLAFPSGIGEQVQAITIMFQNISNFTIGLALHAGGREGGNWKKTLQAVFHLPMIYTLCAAWIFRGFHIPLPDPVHHALDWLADGLVPIALVTLGAQMASLKSHQLGFPLLAALFLRLCIGPVLGFAFVKLLGFQDQALAQAVVVSTSFPTAVNSALLAMEYDNEPDFAASVVFYSTLISSVTVSVVIYLVKHYL